MPESNLPLHGCSRTNKVHVSSTAQPVREFTGGIDAFDLEADSVRGLLSALERRFPGLGEYVADHMAIAINGELHQDALAAALPAGAEVVLIPRISGG